MSSEVPASPTTGGDGALGMVWRMQRLLGPAAAGLLFGNFFVAAAVTCALIGFWLLRWWLVPSELLEIPLFLQYPSGGDVSMSACANVTLPRLPVGYFDTDVHLHLTTPHADSRGGLQPHHGVLMCALELLRANSSEVASSSRPLLLPAPHWLLRLWSVAMRGPFVALGLLQDERIAIGVQLLENIRMPRDVISAISTARVCLRPPLPVYLASLHFSFRVIGPLRIIQKYPLTCSIIILVCTVALAWGVVSCVGFVLLLWQLCKSATVSSDEGEVEPGAECGRDDAGFRNEGHEDVDEVGQTSLTVPETMTEIEAIIPEVTTTGRGASSATLSARRSGKTGASATTPSVASSTNQYAEGIPESTSFQAAAHEAYTATAVSGKSIAFKGTRRRLP